MIDSLIKRTTEAGNSADDIEKHYADVVGDNIAASNTGAKLLKKSVHMYLGLAGCCSHSAYLLCELICSVAAIQTECY